MMDGSGSEIGQGTLRRTLARALLLVAVLGVALCAPGRALAATRAIGFSNLVIRLQDDEIGLASGDYRVLILEALRGAGLNAVGAENLVFNQDAAESAELVLGGTLSELECIEVKKRGNCRVAIEWQLFDVQHEAVVYKAVTRHAEFGYDGQNSKSFGRRLVLGALQSLLGRKTFRGVVGESKRAESTSYSMTAFGACGASPLQMPGSFEDAAKATVLISTGKGFGSGFFLGSDGLVLTAAHVVSGSTVELMLRDRTKLKARPVRISREHDVALLVVERSGSWPCMGLGLGAKVPGTDVYAIGAPASQDLAFSLTRGILSGVRELNGIELLQTDASLSPGNSGGPLIDGSGRVLGVVSGKLTGTAVEGVGFAVPIDKALQALGLQAGAASDASLLGAKGIAGGGRESGKVFVDATDDVPSLDPEADRARERDARTPGSVNVMRWGGLGLVGAGLAGAFFTQRELQPGQMTQSEYESIRLKNDIAWVAVGVGGAAFCVSWFLVPGDPGPKRGPRGGRLKLEFSASQASLAGEF